MTPNRSFSRRDLLKLAAQSFAGLSASGWLPALAAHAASDPKRKWACILLWMSGGPSQMETFDPKSGHANGGPVKAVDTSVPGIQISEYLPNLAKHMRDMAVVRSMSTKEGDHARATYLLRTGYLPQGPIHFPTMGSLLSKELGRDDAELPNYVSISPYTFLSPGAFGPGFLGPQHAPLVVGGSDAGVSAQASHRDYAQGLRVKNLDLPDNVTLKQADARLRLLGDLEQDFADRRGGVSADSHRDAYDRAVRMMHSETVKAFNLDEEPAQRREAYGQNLFGQGCLLARRLVERGVPFVEVSLNQSASNRSFAWDTHVDNFNAVKSLCEALDPAWSTLMSDLRDRGLLESTLIVWMGEFGRTPKINQNAGRDHFPNAWSTVLSGGGIRGGQVVGKTSADGTTVEDRPVTVPDLIATICNALGVDPMNQNISNVGRPIRLVDPDATPINEIVASGTAK